VKKDVKSWEFWVVVALLGVAVYALYQAYQLAVEGVSWVENSVGNAESVAGSVAGGFVAAVLVLLGLGGSSTSNNSSGSGSGSGSGGP